MVTENSIRTFASQYYTGPGAIIPVRFTIKTNGPREFIKYTSVTFTPDEGTHKEEIVLPDVGSDAPYGIWEDDELLYNLMSQYDVNSSGDMIVFNKHFFQRNGKITIEFNILSKVPRQYDMVFTFITSSSRTITRRLSFSTIDVDNLSLSIYKIVSKKNVNAFTYDDFYTTDMNDYFFKIQNTNPMVYNQYLPYMPNPDENYNGIKLNRTIVVDVRGLTRMELTQTRMRLADYLLFYRYGENDSINYIIGVSKFFNAPTPPTIEYSNKVIRNDLGFYPQFHTIKRLNGNSITDYTISQYDALCVIPEIHKYGNTYERFRYGHLIEGSEWEFINQSENLTTSHPSSARASYISSNNGEPLKDGFYDIVFRYRIGGEQRELRLNSAFRKKTV
jgi:hypothetical protein